MSSNAATENYTPHGYLSNPNHMVKLGRSGLLRSAEPMGFALWYPNYPGPYGRKFGYCAEINLALAIGKRTYTAPADLKNWHCPTHTSERFVYAATAGPVDVRATYFLMRDGLLRCVVTLRNTSSRACTVRMFALCEYQRNGAFSGLWEEGLLARTAGRKAVELMSHSEGAAVGLGCDAPCDAVACFKTLSAARRAIKRGESLKRYSADVVQNNRNGENRVAGVLAVDCPLKPGKQKTLTFSMAWTGVVGELQTLLATPAAETRKALARKTAADKAIQAGAVSLSGDWPDYWRRGMHYDLQTLRMCVLPPRGVFKHPWDAMQIQAPRYVLAETTLDMFMYGYSDPAGAQDVVLGPMEDMLAAGWPWMPCLREDGSANMIAWDGHPCGTAPEWGAPAWVIERLYRRKCDRRWLASVLKPLSEYLLWWDAHRTDKQGFVHYQSSYESGQDMSPRFNPQRGGGDDVTHCRPVDLQAAMADSWRFVADAQAMLGRRKAAQAARKRAGHYRRRLKALWAGKWYCDYSTKRGGFTSQRDVMHLAPFYYGLAASEQAKAIRARAVKIFDEGIVKLWPTFMLMLTESLYQLGCSQRLTEVCTDRVEHVYSALDARRSRPDRPLPGVQHEYWPDKGRWGAEGYGWGTFGIAMVLRYIAGWREDGPLASTRWTLAPAMPKMLLRKGRCYRLANLPALSRRFELTYTASGGGRLDLRLAACDGRPCRGLTLRDAAGNVLARSGRDGVVSASIQNHKRYEVSLKG